MTNREPVMSVGCVREGRCLCGKCSSPSHPSFPDPAPAIERGPWIQTFSGRRMHPFNPTPESIDILDIAHALSNLCRFTGHTRHFYSVAQHSVHAADFAVPEIAAQALLHDAAEAYLNDIASPIKHALGLEGYRAAEHKLMGGIFVRFGLPRALDPRVEEVDARMLATEREQLMNPTAEVSDAEWGVTHQPFGYRLPAMTPGRAKDSFLNRFYHLFPLEHQP